MTRQVQFSSPNSLFGVYDLGNSSITPDPGASNTIQKNRCDSLSALNDPRLDLCVKNLGKTFELIVISSCPLVHSGINLKSEDLATRIWYNGKAEFDDKSNPSSAQMEDLLKCFAGLIKDLHGTRNSLFLHPLLFRSVDQKKFHKSICFDSVVGPPKSSEKSRETKFEIPSTIQIMPKIGCLHAESVLNLDQSKLDDIWQDVDTRCKNESRTLHEDLELCLKNSAINSHNLLCSWLDENNKNTVQSCTTMFYSAPISSVLFDDSSRNGRIPNGIVGMFWVTLVTRSNQIKGKYIKKKINQLLRTLWLVLLSNNTVKRAEAIFLLGSSAATDAATHEMKNVAVSLGKWVVNSTELFEFEEVQLGQQLIADGKIGRVTIDAKSAFAKEDIAFLFLPKLFQQGLDYIVNWTMSDAPKDLPFYNGNSQAMPQSLEELALKCWSATFESLIFSKIEDMHWSIGGLTAMKLAMEKIRELFPTKPVNVTGGDIFGSLIWISDTPSARTNVWLSRLMIHLFREAIQHGDWAKQIQVDCALNLPVDQKIKIRISNSIGMPDEKKDALHSLLSDLTHLDLGVVAHGDKFLAENNPSGNGFKMRGRNVLDYLCNKLNATLSWSEENENPFWREITLSINR